MNCYSDVEQEILIESPFINITEFVSDPLALPENRNSDELLLQQPVKQEIITDPLLLTKHDENEFKPQPCPEELLLKEETVSGPDAYEKPFKCGICGYKTAIGGDLEKHVETHTGDRPFKCETCNRETTWKQCLQLYMKNCPKGEAYYKCIFCEYKTKKIEKLQQHLMNHSEEKCFAQEFEKFVLTDAEKKSFQCYECRIAAKKELEQQIIEGGQNFSCYSCSFKTLTKDLLVKHLESHSMEKFLQCYVCGHRTICKSSLRVHMRTHRPPKVFACKLCDFKSEQRYPLRRHVRIHHPHSIKHRT